ncbi:hypothetical protein SLA_0384 [Streptomyces laurentii]|uniref:NIF system FeS cluster assembly NifU C-terminal domain-containing protein n=1 Tax=Streptomyces laurentii TaxID=39478 RepID=A0A160NSL4_STRLU|nr:hypothetical protein SLA_0384 [Streptomyces laurentii]
MSAVTAEQAGRRVEEVLDRLAEKGDAATVEAAEDVVRVLMEFYGSALARVVELLGQRSPGTSDTPGSSGNSGNSGAPAAPLGPLLADALVASLLHLHGLHPEDLPSRIDRALAGLPQPVRNAGFDTASGVLRLSVAVSSGCGCGSTPDATRDATRQAALDALACFAPEVTGVELEPAEAREPALLQIGARPSYANQGGPGLAPGGVA